jgi:hypothetical protein
MFHSIWTAKYTISEFLKRIYAGVWKKSYQRGLQLVRWNLLITFVGVVVATLAECQPFDHYWQVVPDPGPHCRQGYAQLLTMGVTDVVTDLVLVIFPIPIIIFSNMPMKRFVSSSLKSLTSLTVRRKVSLVLLFALSLILVAITIYRVYATIQRDSNQQFRSLLASLEILAAAGVSNALVLGSFVRDRGAKKQRFRFNSTSGSSFDRPSVAKARPRAALSWGSDSDLVSDMGYRLGPEFAHDKPKVPRPAPAVLPLASPAEAITPAQPSWGFPGRDSVESDLLDLKVSAISGDNPPSPRDVSILTPRRMSFFDVGGLLGDDVPPRASSISNSVPSSATYSATHSLRPLVVNSTARRGSRTLLEDVSDTELPRSGPDSSSNPSSAAEMYFPG